MIPAFQRHTAVLMTPPGLDEVFAILSPPVKPTFLRDLSQFFLHHAFALVGWFLVVAPWQPLWEHHWLFRLTSPWASVGLSPMARGIASGIGLALVLHATREIVSRADELRP